MVVSQFGIQLPAAAVTFHTHVYTPLAKLGARGVTLCVGIIVAKPEAALHIIQVIVAVYKVVQRHALIWRRLCGSPESDATAYK